MVLLRTAAEDLQENFQIKQAMFTKKVILRIMDYYANMEMKIRLSAVQKIKWRNIADSVKNHQNVFQVLPYMN